MYMSECAHNINYAMTSVPKGGPSNSLVHKTKGSSELSCCQLDGGKQELLLKLLKDQQVQ